MQQLKLPAQDAFLPDAVHHCRMLAAAKVGQTQDLHVLLYRGLEPLFGVAFKKVDRAANHQHLEDGVHWGADQQVGGVGATLLLLPLLDEVGPDVG